MADTRREVIMPRKERSVQYGKVQTIQQRL